MTDVHIFGFGLCVTILVGSGLAAMIIAKNRAIEAKNAERDAGSEAPQPAHLRSPSAPPHD